MTDADKMHYLAVYCKKLSDDLREMRIKDAMKDDEIRRLRRLLDALKEETGTTGFLIERDENDPTSVIICGPDDDEIKMCALVYTLAKEIAKRVDGEE